jgi:hypothetical protein
MKNRTDYGDVREMSATKEAMIDREERKSKGLAILLLEASSSLEHPLP